MPKYTYMVSGKAAHDQTWFTVGLIETEAHGQFDSAVDKARRASFEQLTNGQAVYGKPGIGCSGPYVVTRLYVELSELP